ncbi:MAG: replicative DNA helicase [Bifidobacteriaceae bacterium]|jgi:replicative DNA helicase|nr:replicative DNA helicase [Bifidobacteriaceae bacterium]
MPRNSDLADDDAFSEGSAVASSVYRMQPHDELAEKSTLGAMIISENAIGQVLDVISNNDEFYNLNHRLIFDAIKGIMSANSPVDVTTLSAELEKRGVLKKVGGYDYLIDLMDTPENAASAGAYANIVKRTYILRKLVEAGSRIQEIGYRGEDAEIEDIINDAQSEVYRISEEGIKEDYSRIDEVFLETREFLENMDNEMLENSIATGIEALDKKLHNLRPGQLVILAARTSMGKSTFALDIARNAAIKNKKATIFFSLEMSKRELSLRLIAAQCGVKLERLQNGNVNSDAGKKFDWAKISHEEGNIREAPLYIDDSSSLTITDIRTKTRRLRQSEDLKLIIVDYLQLLKSSRNIESRQQEVAELSRDLKLLAKDLNVPILALAQLNRNPDIRKDMPKLSDLRESGSIEQDADVVMFIHRPEEKGDDEQGTSDINSFNREVQIVVAKNRNGPTGAVDAMFQTEFSRFVNVMKHADENEFGAGVTVGTYK